MSSFMKSPSGLEKVFTLRGEDIEQAPLGNTGRSVQCRRRDIDRVASTQRGRLALDVENELPGKAVARLFVHVAVLVTLAARGEKDFDHHQAPAPGANLPADLTGFEDFQRQFGIRKEEIAHRTYAFQVWSGVLSASSHRGVRDMRSDPADVAWQNSQAFQSFDRSR